jgi:hypothetical protein
LHLDQSGKDLWDICAEIVAGANVDPSTALQLQALAIRRELRLEASLNRAYAEMASQVRDIARRIGPARTNEDIRAALDRLASQYEFWSNTGG